MTDEIKRVDLLKFVNARIDVLRERPLSFGGDWWGVEVCVLDILELRDIAIVGISPLPGDIGGRWNKTCNILHPSTGNGSMLETLKFEGFSQAAIVQKLNQALDAFIACDGLYVSTFDQVEDFLIWQQRFRVGKAL